MEYLSRTNVSLEVGPVHVALKCCKHASSTSEIFCSTDLSIYGNHINKDHHRRSIRAYLLDINTVHLKLNSLLIVHLQTSAFIPSPSSPPLQIILLNPNPTGTPTTTAPARTNHLTTPLACARCSSLIVWPSTRRCSIPSFVEESSEIKWPKEALPRDGLCWALAQEDSSMGARFFWEYEREGCDFDA